MKWGMYWHAVISNSDNCEKHKKHVHHVHHSSRACRTFFISPNQSVLDQKHECNSSHGAVLYIFQIIEI